MELIPNTFSMGKSLYATPGNVSKPMKSYTSTDIFVCPHWKPMEADFYIDKEY